MDARPLVKEKKPSEIFTIYSYIKQLENLVAEMQKTSDKKSDTSDDKNANRQLAFAEETLALLKKMVTIPNNKPFEKRSVGIELSEVNAKFFGKDEIPIIQGEKSKAFASLLAQHFKDLEKVQFNDQEISWSEFFSKIPLINIRSISQQVEHHRMLGKRLEKQIEDYKKVHEAQPVIAAPGK